MRLRTFFANDMKDALAAMRAELGDDAIIVASETLNDGTVLLRAGIDSGSQESHDGATPSAPPAPEGHAGGAELLSFDVQYRNALLARLRTPAPASARPVAQFDLAALRAQLIAHRVPENLAGTLAAAAEESGLADPSLALASVLDQRTKLTSLALNAGRAIFLLGPPGSGKTSVAAKLAAQARLANISVQLAITDLESAGQAARLESLARCLDVEALRIPNAESLAEAMATARAKNILLIADSVACHPFGTIAPELRAFLSLDGFEFVGVLPAACDAEEAGEAVARLAGLGATHLVVTGLDLARRKGALLALATAPLSIAFTTASPYLSAGLQTLTPLTLSRALLGDDFSGAARKIA